MPCWDVALVSNPQILILDEPNTNIDKRFETHLYTLLEEINREHAIILVSHDINTVLQHAQNIACVKSHPRLFANQGSDWKMDRRTFRPITIHKINKTRIFNNEK